MKRTVIELESKDNEKNIRNDTANINFQRI